MNAFRLSAAGVRDDTQIHTHMCYAKLNDIIEAIAALDADVITIETSRSNMELLEAFVNFSYPNEIGPGVYDIHSPRIPKVAEMTGLLRKAEAVLPRENLWINPDCGLKTRGWLEVSSLINMVAAAVELRQRPASIDLNNSASSALSSRRGIFIGDGEKLSATIEAGISQLAGPASLARWENYPGCGER